MCLPEELIVDILSRLPVKSLEVCKSVSKPWCRLINTPYFVQTHLLCSSMKAKVESTQFVVVFELLMTELYILKDLNDKPVSSVGSSSSPWKQKVEFPKYKNPRCFPQPCRGLLSFTTHFPSDTADNITVVAINPATREFRELPKLGPIIDPMSFREGQSHIVFDPSSNTYKVLWLFMGEKYKTNMVSVINLVNDVSWRNVVFPNTDADECSYFAFPSLHHGIPYEFNRRGGSQLKILVFDVKHENFLTFNFLHDREASHSGMRTAAACQGSIYVFCASNATATNKVVDVWVMRDCKISKTWVKEKSCNLQFLYEEDPSTDAEFSSLMRRMPQYQFHGEIDQSSDTERKLWKITLHGVIDHRIILKIQTRVGYGIHVIYDSITKEFQRYKSADKEIMKSMRGSRVVLRGDFYESLVSPKLGY